VLQRSSHGGSGLAGTLGRSISCSSTQIFCACIPAQIQPPQRDILVKPLMSLFIALNIWLYRLSGGRVMGTMRGAPILLLTTTGRKSGRRRTVPLLYLKDEGTFVIVASFAGAPKHPAWYLNLQADSKVNLQVGSRRFDGAARRASVDEKARLWPRLLAIYPQYADYQKRTPRDIPVVIVSPM
jgi:F420H(2)-dependent quinone reductase